jgi:hypothetical protein
MTKMNMIGQLEVHHGHGKCPTQLDLPWTFAMAMVEFTKDKLVRTGGIIRIAQLFRLESWTISLLWHGKHIQFDDLPSLKDCFISHVGLL